MDARPEISVVVATYNRAPLLEALLGGLRSQTLPRDRFEVVVVDDGSTDGTGPVLEREQRRGELGLRVIAHDRNLGLAPSRQEGWQAAQAGLLAFTDDDCVPDPDWLAAGLAASERLPEAIIQGRTDPRLADRARLPRSARPFARTLSIPRADPHVQTCNAFYPRRVLEAVGGLDAIGFARYVGDDADLAWRAIEAGTEVGFAADARVQHAFLPLGPIGKLRYAASWDFKVYALHPGLRRAYFTRGVFWKGSHYLLCRALVAALLPRRMRLIRAWLGVPYSVHLVERGRDEGGGPLLAPYFVLHDLIELGAALRSSLRYRKLML